MGGGKNQREKNLNTTWGGLQIYNGPADITEKKGELEELTTQQKGRTSKA